MTQKAHYDVVIIGAGLAGLTLARHLLLETDKTVLLLERRRAKEPKKQKVGESSVQVGGYYLSRVLDLEDYLLHEHFMKYNLRFYWHTPGRDGRNFEDYSSSYIRPFSNIASYQLDRNTLEVELWDRNLADPRCSLHHPATQLDIQLAEGEGAHQVSYAVDGERHAAEAAWVVDTTGRGRHLARRQGSMQTNAIDHGAYFLWVEGLVDIERLSDRPRDQWRLDPARRELGHLPAWLATNHFMDEGLWLWTIPLRGKTSIGLVFENRVVDRKDVQTPEKMIDWICERFPLFARDLPHRKVLDFGGYKSFSHGCSRTISEQRWALSGESGRFLDPLYSPGSDFIAYHNTLIVDAIKTDDPDELTAKCRGYEQLLRAFYESYVPGYAVSYDAIGDQETMVFKYGWELAVYFALYTFPFINDLLTERRFTVSFLSRLSKLGPINRGLQRFLSGYFQWKQERKRAGTAEAVATGEPLHFAFDRLAALARAAETFYEVGIDVTRARRVLDEQVEHLEELGRFIVAHTASVVLEAPDLVTSRSFVEGIDFDSLDFEPEALAARWSAARDADRNAAAEPFAWSFCPTVTAPFRPAATPRTDRAADRPAEAMEGVLA